MVVSKATSRTTPLGGTDGTAIGNVADAMKVNIENPSYSGVPVALSNESRDAFHRLRVSSPTTLFDYEFKYNHDVDLYWSFKNTGAATHSHDANTISHKLEVTTASGDKAIAQTRRRVEYIKGKSQLIYLTGNFHGTQTNTRKRIGAFDANNGVFFEIDGLTVRVVRRSKTSGSVVDQQINQSNWNLDTLDGSADLSNTSGVLLDPTKQQLFIIDYSWLGSNVVRWGIIISNEIIYVHQENYSNVITVPYSQSGQLPIRAEIENTGTAAGASSLTLTCGTVISEGGSTEEANGRALDSGLVTVKITTTPMHLFAIRINPATPYSSIKSSVFNILATSGNSEIIYRFLFNPTVVGGVWADQPNSIAQRLTSLTSYSGGHLLDSEYASVGKFSHSESFKSDLFLGLDIDGVPDILLVEVQTISSTAKVLFTHKRKEYI